MASTKPYYMVIHGRRRYFADLASAKRAAHRIFQQTGVIVGIFERT